MSTARAFEVTLSDGATLMCNVVGEGTPVLWVSGLSGVASFWESICTELDGVMSITFDQRGLRASKRGESPASVDLLARDAVAILDALGIEQAHVVGHSTGGCIAITMALAAPTRISSLILSGSWAGPHLYLDALFGWRLKLLETDPHLYEAIGPFLSNTSQWLIDHPQHLSASKALTAQTVSGAPAVPATPATQPAPWSGERIRVIKERIGALMAFDRRQELDRLTPPCLVLGARDDVVIPLFLQEELARLIPNATLKVFEQGAHFFPRSQSLAFVDLVRAWLASNHHG